MKVLEKRVELTIDEKLTMFHYLLGALQTAAVCSPDPKEREWASDLLEKATNYVK